MESTHHGGDTNHLIDKMTQPDGVSQMGSDKPQSSATQSWQSGHMNEVATVAQTEASHEPNSMDLTYRGLANCQYWTSNRSSTMSKDGPPKWHHSLRRPTCHLVCSWLHRPHPSWKGPEVCSHGNKHVLPPVLSQHSHPPRSSFKEGPAAQSWREQTAYSHHLLRGQPLLESPLPQDHALPRAAHSGDRGQRGCERYASLMQDNSNNSGFMRLIAGGPSAQSCLHSLLA